MSLFMIHHIARGFILILFPTVLLGQSLDLSVPSPTANNNPSTFLLEQGEITIRSHSILFRRSGTTIKDFAAWGISPDNSIVGILKDTPEGGEMALLNSRGDTLYSYSTATISSDDPSLAVYPSNNGTVMLRDNITNFTFYDKFGEIYANTSSGSQSEEGEAISEVAMNPTWETLITYSPKIKRGNNFGSKAQVKLSDRKFKDIFTSTDRFIKDFTVSEDGHMVMTITARQGTADQVLIMDKYGNRINEISADENIVGASLSADNEYITLYSRGRVMVYSVMDGNSLGATSFNANIFMADYFPEDDLILALTGDYSEGAGVLNNVEFRAVNLEQRSITSEELDGSLGFTEKIEPALKRLSSGEYQLVGSSKRIKIGANF